MFLSKFPRRRRGRKKSTRECHAKSNHPLTHHHCLRSKGLEGALFAPGWTVEAGPHPFADQQMWGGVPWKQLTVDMVAYEGDVLSRLVLDSCLLSPSLLLSSLLSSSPRVPLHSSLFFFSPPLVSLTFFPFYSFPLLSLSLSPLFLISSLLSSLFLSCGVHPVLCSLSSYFAISGDFKVETGGAVVASHMW